MFSRILLFVFSLLIPITCISQNTYKVSVEDSMIVITPTQLKQTNLIFNEHSKLLKENKILNGIISDYSKIVVSYKTLDSLNNTKISNYQQEIDKTKETLKKSKFWNRVKTWTICGISLYALIITLIHV
jgi:hypothetical protein